MREEHPSENRAKASKFADQNQIPKGNTVKSNNSNLSKLRSASSWGSHIVKGFSAEKKTKSQTKKMPLTSSEMANQKNPFVPSHARVKRSLIGEFPCSANPRQVHPHSLNTLRVKSSASNDLFTELEQLRSLLQESKERELKLQAELSECKRNPKVLDLESELETKKSEVSSLEQKVGCLEAEKEGLSEQLVSLSCNLERQEEVLRKENPQDFEMETVELRRLNKELQLEKRNLTCRLSFMESQLATLPKASEVLLPSFLCYIVLIS